MAIAYGSITLVDIGDLGQLSVVPESNQPSTVIYDPNAVIEQQYNPNWETSNLILTPVIYYGGTQLTLGKTNGLTVVWKRKVGSGDPTTLITGENVDGNGVLTVSSNQFTGSISQLTYICSVSYSDPTTMGTAELEAQGQITFSLIKNASKVKSASITGESVFLYNANSELVQTGPITLTANLNSLDLVAWGYKNNSGDWTRIQSTSKTLSVEANSPYFIGDIATFRLYTQDSTTGEETEITDIHVITKIRDGLPGDQVISVILTNENQMIPCDSKGNPINGAFNGASTTISVYEGSTDVTDEWEITYELNNVKGSWNSSTNTFTAEELSANIGSVNFTCTPSLDSPYNSPVYKKFNLTKIQPGADGVSPIVYSLDVSSLVVNKNIASIYSPSSLTIKAWSQTGTNAKAAYAGRFKIYAPDNLSIYTSTENESSFVYTNAGKTPLTIELYEADGTTKLLDSQTVITVLDGQTGEPGETGASGKDAISFVLGNYQDVIPCTNAGYTATSFEIKIPFAAYKGGEKVGCSATLSTLPNGMAIKTNSSATANADGEVVITVSSGRDLGGSNVLEGRISVTLVAEGVSNTQTYSWVKNVQAADGTNAILFQIFAPNGNIIANGENSVVLQTSMVNGTASVTSGLAYQWAKWNGSIYEDISDATGSSYTVQASEVSSYTSYRCTATYGGQSYEAYLSVYDKTDPLQLRVQSTLGDKIVNSVGQGLIYVLIYRNGQELDPMKTISHGTTYPTNATIGDYFYFLDTAAQTATLKKYSGSVWADVDGEDDYSASYNWTLRDSTNAIVDVKSGKAIYVDHAVVNKKMTFDVEVTI